MLRRLRCMFSACMPRCKKSPTITSEYKDPGEKLQLGDIIGEGAFGQVYKGHHLETNETVAIKVLSGETNTNEEINNEIEILKNYTKHENIVSFYGAHLQPMGILWITMEYCGGGTVKDLIANTLTRTLPETWIAYITREILKALKHLHKKRVVHRDIKGANIALTEDARVRLIDFGISKKLKGRFDACKDPVGTSHYFAPEVWKCVEDNNASYNCKCDIWSLGITAIEMAEGRCPLANLDAFLAGMKIVQCDPPTLRVQNKWSTEFNSFLSLCLKKDPKVRRSAKQLLKHPFVRDLQNVEMIRAEIQSQIYRVNEAKSKKVDVKPKEQPERISMGDFEKAMAAIEDLQWDNISFSNSKNLNPEDHGSSAIVEKDTGDPEKLAQQTEDASCNGEEKITECNKKISDAAELSSQAENISDTDEELFVDALDLFNSDFTQKTETAASTEDEAMKILDAPNEPNEGAEEFIYTAMAAFYILNFLVFMSGLVLSGF